MNEASKQQIREFINLHLMVGFMVPAPTSVVQRASVARLSRVEGAVEVRAIRTLEGFYERIPVTFRAQVQKAFDGVAKLKYAEQDMVLYRHISQDGAEISYWYARTMESPANARKLFALPNTNTAEWVVKVKVPMGTPYIEGKIASQITDPIFGSYATGGGNQIYFLQENLSAIEVIEKIVNPLR